MQKLAFFCPLPAKNKQARHQSQPEHEVSLAGQEALVGGNEVSAPALLQALITSPVPGEFSFSLGAGRVWALPGDMLVTEEGQEERLFGE